MKYQAEYTIKIKLEDITTRPDSTENDLEEKIKLLGRKNLKKFFEGSLLDPDKRVICEEITYEPIKEK
jgi:hypothetical protein